MSLYLDVRDFSESLKLAWNLYRTLYKTSNGAPRGFKLLVRGLSSAHNSIKLIQEATDSSSALAHAGGGCVEEMGKTMNEVYITLEELGKQVEGYENLGRERHRLR